MVGAIDALVVGHSYNLTGIIDTHGLGLKIAGEVKGGRSAIIHKPMKNAAAVFVPSHNRTIIVDTKGLVITVPWVNGGKRIRESMDRG